VAGQIAGLGDAQIDRDLRKVLRSIEPTAAQKSGARRSHWHLRELLDKSQLGNRIVDIYLSGSYARETAIRPLDDVDIIVVVDPSYWDVPWLSTLPPPSKVIDTFAGAIRRRYPASTVFKQRRSVCLQLAHICIDVVPAVKASDKPKIRIPDRDSGEWILSAPVMHAEVSARVNHQRAGLFKPVVKLAKLWSSVLPDSSRAKSFTIETIATRLFSEIPFATLEEGLLLFWDFLASRFHEPTIAKWNDDFGMIFSWWEVAVPDAAGTNSNTASYMSRAHALALSKQARVSRDHLCAARKARAERGREERVLRALRIT
jgi:hypothetical protein